ncbi:hypothetical protein BDV36DRAFT_252496 [Aspergillus pseudocaelatus]|uniref:Uncharacterized protein n=1 Tax=Aspergillus pseudocaelatus TaxID=1825620 RepID=A0ABQ6WPQ2_9EURO|nr:hypothetical protein BDV36DRAFT_252496 [Aspergillus pseudocaelatus]
MGDFLLYMILDVLWWFGYPYVRYINLWWGLRGSLPYRFIKPRIFIFLNMTR